MIETTIGNYIALVGIGLFFVFRFYKGKYRYIILLIGIGLIAIRFSMKEIVVLNANQKMKKFLTFKSSLDYNFHNGISSTIPISSNTLINDTEDKLIIEKVEYSIQSSTSSGDNIEKTIDPFSYAQLENKVSYFYEEPPKTIKVKSGGTTIRYWLHK